MADIAISEAARAVGNVVRLARPQPTAEQREAGQQRYLHQLFAGLLLRGMPVVNADQLVERETCVLHVLEQFASGELVAAAVEQM